MAFSSCPVMLLALLIFYNFIGCHLLTQTLNSASNNRFLNEMLKIVEMVRFTCESG